MNLTFWLSGGWIAEKEEVDMDNVIVPNLSDEIDQAFKNVEYNLKHAGGKGFSQVYKVVTYSTNIREQHEHIVRNLRKWFPERPPIWTEIGVKQLGADEMHFEIDVEAYDPEGTA
jgi:enamine deaminase RidA (YjgF/YER057c/UK114 family)